MCQHGALKWTGVLYFCISTLHSWVFMGLAPRKSKNKAQIYEYEHCDIDVQNKVSQSDSGHWKVGVYNVFF